MDRILASRFIQMDSRNWARCRHPWTVDPGEHGRGSEHDKVHHAGLPSRAAQAGLLVAMKKHVGHLMAGTVPGMPFGAPIRL